MGKRMEKPMVKRENHSMYNDCDGKTRTVQDFIAGLRAPHVHYNRDETGKVTVSVENLPRPYLQVINEALLLARHGRLDEALDLVGYKNDQSVLDLYFDSDGNRVRAKT